MKEFKKLEELKQSKSLQSLHLTMINKLPSESDFFKAFIKEKRIDQPLAPKEKGSAFKYLLREYIYKFPLLQGNHSGSAYYAGKAVNLILRYARKKNKKLLDILHKDCV